MRHCDSCKSSVYNLSEMSDEDTEALLARSDEVCIRYYSRPDGTLVKTNCADKPRRAGATAAAGMAMTLATTTAFVGIDAVMDSSEVAQVEGERMLVAMGGLKLTVKPHKLTPEERVRRDQRRKARMAERALADAPPIGLAAGNVNVSFAPSPSTPQVSSVTAVSTPSRTAIFGVLAIFGALLAWVMRRRWPSAEPR